MRLNWGFAGQNRAKCNLEALGPFFILEVRSWFVRFPVCTEQKRSNQTLLNPSPDWRVEPYIYKLVLEIKREKEGQYRVGLFVASLFPES